jgi:glycine/D-amino acid oxidase-like deaminating enzyme
MQRGAQVLVIDNEEEHSASLSAPALINPVTGRQYVKSWNIDQLLPLAVNTYEYFGELLDERFFEPCNILRALPGEFARKRWQERGKDPEYTEYLDGVIRTSGSACFEPFEYGIVRGGFRVRIRELLNSFKEHLRRQKAFRSAVFNYQRLQSAHGDVTYDNLQPKAVIFCEGYQAVQNPYLPVDCIRPNKGDYFICRIPKLTFKQNEVLKHRLFFISLGNDLFWVGSTYERAPADNNPGREAFLHLKQAIDELLSCKYEIIAHNCGIRPTVKDRRPVVGEHPDIAGVWFLNGMGTKAASLAPFCSKVLADALLHDKFIPREIALSRWLNKKAQP